MKHYSKLPCCSSHSETLLNFVAFSSETLFLWTLWFQVNLLYHQHNSNLALWSILILWSWPFNEWNLIKPNFVDTGLENSRLFRLVLENYDLQQYLNIPNQIWTLLWIMDTTTLSILFHLIFLVLAYTIRVNHFIHIKFPSDHIGPYLNLQKLVVWNCIL